jgi:hypothetical protein
MVCPNLRYRSSDDEREFEHERPYCTVTESFVSPMRADICNDRYDLDHETDCEIYRDHEGLPAMPGAADE